jgi:hypothetical protein
MNEGTILVYCCPSTFSLRPSFQRVNDGKARATFTRYIKYDNRHRGPPKISSRMISDQRVGMKVAWVGYRTEVARMKVAG